MPDYGTSATQEEHAPASAGLLGAIRGLADGLLESARQRVELFSLELREEKLRAVQLLIWIGAAMFAAALALTLASVTIVYLFWETARLPVLIGLTLFYAGGCAVAVHKVRRYLNRQPRPFEGTLTELQHDRACIRPQS